MAQQEPKWAIIWVSMHRLKPKGLPLSPNGEEGAVPHLQALMVQLQVIPLPLLVFFLLLLFLLLPERTYSHTITRGNLAPFCRDSVHFHHRDTEQLYGFAGGKVRGERGSSSRGTLPPAYTLPQLSTVLQITDKLWQMGSGKCILHTHVTPLITLLPPPRALLQVPREGPYQCEEVTEGNANLTWGACSLLFISCLLWQEICSSRRRSTCLITGFACSTLDG